MKRVTSIFYVLIMVFGVIMFNSCGEDESCSDGIQNQDESGVDCGGVCTACFTCSDGIQNGDETGVDCGGTNCDACIVGVHGNWESSGANIAPILAPFASKIVATFNTDGTYSVVQTDLDGAEITLAGTFVQTESAFDGIWDITLNQSSPSQLTAQGIFTIDAAGLLKYEVAQIDPAISGVTAPTAEGGLGSTSGGAFGLGNVQTYVEL